MKRFVLCLLACMAMSLLGLSSCEKEQEASPVCFSCSFDAKGGYEEYYVDLDGASLSLNVNRTYFEEDMFCYEDYEWVDVYYLPELERLSIFVRGNYTGRDRKAVVGGYHRTSGQKYMFEIEQSK